MLKIKLRLVISDNQANKGMKQLNITKLMVLAVSACSSGNCKYSFKKVGIKRNITLIAAAITETIVKEREICRDSKRNISVIGFGESFFAFWYSKKMGLSTILFRIKKPRIANNPPNKKGKRHPH